MPRILGVKVDPFWGTILQESLKQIGPKLAQAVGDIFRALWVKRAKTPPTLASASPFDTPPPLPLAFTPLVGREADFAGVLGALMNHRLVTLTGLGGVGKTALAQTIARWVWEEDRAKSKTPRGVPYVALDALSSGRELADFVRRKLLPDSPPPATVDENARQSDAVRVIADALNAGARLLVLDNFESAMDSEGAPLALDFVHSLIAATSDAVRVLVTSRRALNLAPIEFEYALEPLEEKHAIELFYERAGQSVNVNDRPTIAEICRLEDCLPLGIELAAAAVQQRTRPLKEMLSTLRVTPLDVEIADALGYPERQRGLAATLRYTYDHLPSDAARRLFCAFSVFRGGADRDAVKYVDSTDAWETALRDLVIWKPLNVDTTREPWRYTMLGTTAAFSALQMQNQGETLGLNANALQRRHAKYFVTVASRFDKTPMENWREIEVDWQNIKAGADWAVCELEAREGATVDELLVRLDSLPTDAKDAGLAGDYAYQLFKFVFYRCPNEGRSWLGAGIISFHHSGDKGKEKTLGSTLGLWLTARGYYDDALRWHETGLRLAEELGDKAGMAAIYNNIGLIHNARGDYATALEWYEKSIALNEVFDNKAVLATTYNNIGGIHYLRGDYDAALEWYEKSVALKEFGEKTVLATTYNNIGEIHRARRDYLAAMEWYEKSIVLNEALDNKTLLGKTYNNVSAIHFAQGNLGESLKWLTQALEIAREIDARHDVALYSYNAAMLSLAMGDHAQAKQYAQESLRLYEQMKVEKDAANVIEWMKENGLS